MKTTLSSIRCDGEVTVRLTGREVEAVSLGLRTLLITTPHDGALGDAAATGFSKLPGTLRSDERLCALRGEHDMNRRLTLPVVGLSLGGCGALTLEREIRRIAGVSEVYVNPATENAYVDFDTERVTPTAIADKIRELGYETEVSAP